MNCVHVPEVINAYWGSVKTFESKNRYLQKKISSCNFFTRSVCSIFEYPVQTKYIRTSQKFASLTMYSFEKGVKEENLIDSYFQVFLYSKDSKVANINTHQTTEFKSEQIWFAFTNFEATVKLWKKNDVDFFLFRAILQIFQQSLITIS